MIRMLAPRYWGGHLAMVLAVAIAVGLGLWQLDAWHSRREAARQDLSALPALPLASVMGGDSAFPAKQLGRAVTFSGRWMASSTVYISGQEHDGHNGYWVVTPVLVSGTRSAMPVVRGWSPTPSSPSPTGTPSVTAWLQPGLGDDQPDADPDDDVLPVMRIPSLVEKVPADLYSGYVISERPDSGLAAVHPSQAPEVGQTTALRNLFYAVEWWVFGLFALVIWLRWCRDTVNPPAPEPAVTAPIGSGV